MAQEVQITLHILTKIYEKACSDNYNVAARIEKNLECDLYSFVTLPLDKFLPFFSFFSPLFPTE